MPAPDLLLTSTDQVGLNSALAWADTTACERLIATAEPRERAGALQQAAGLVRGPFLDGFALPDRPEFDQWATQERQLWERRFLETLAALVEQHTARGDYSAANDQLTEPPAGHTGLHHVAIVYPNAQALACAVQRLFDHEYSIDGAEDHGGTVSVYLRDPDGNGIELYYDRPREEWFDAADNFKLQAEPFDPRELLAESLSSTAQ